MIEDKSVENSQQVRAKNWSAKMTKHHVTERLSGWFSLVGWFRPSCSPDHGAVMERLVVE